MDLIEQVRQNTRDALKFITDRVVSKANIGIILGSGLGGLVDAVDHPRVLAYNEIPHFPKSTVQGHNGNLVFGTLAGKEVAIMQGRFHYYEGYTSAGVSFPVRVLGGLGIKTLIVTCAAGGLRPDLQVGDIMAITDHVNLMCMNPLIGPNDDDLGPRFVDMSEAYNRGLLKIAENSAKEEGIDLKEGIYVAMVGPTYETPAEVRFLSTVGDAVGMSTVPEVMVANYLGMLVLGFAIITNTPGSKRALSHDGVLTEAQRATNNLAKLIINVLKKI